MIIYGSKLTLGKEQQPLGSTDRIKNHQKQFKQVLKKLFIDHTIPEKSPSEPVFFWTIALLLTMTISHTSSSQLSKEGTRPIIGNGSPELYKDTMSSLLL